MSTWNGVAHSFSPIRWGRLIPESQQQWRRWTFLWILSPYSHIIPSNNFCPTAVFQPYEFNFCGWTAMPGAVWTNTGFLASMDRIFLEEAGHLLFWWVPGVPPCASAYSVLERMLPLTEQSCSSRLGLNTNPFLTLTPVFPAGSILCSSVPSSHNILPLAAFFLKLFSTLQDWKLETRKLTPSNSASSTPSLVGGEAVKPHFFPLFLYQQDGEFRCGKVSSLRKNSRTASEVVWPFLSAKWKETVAFIDVL